MDAIITVDGVTTGDPSVVAGSGSRVHDQKRVLGSGSIGAAIDHSAFFMKSATESLPMFKGEQVGAPFSPTERTLCGYRIS